MGHMLRPRKYDNRTVALRFRRAPGRS